MSSHPTNFQGSVVDALREAIPADAFSSDMAKDVALKDLLGRM